VQVRNLIIYNKTFSFLTGVKCEQLTQPASVTVQPGQRLTITCQVSYSVSSYYTGWIRQPAGKGLEWIGSGRVGGNKYYKDSLKNKFSIDLDSSSNRVTLNGQNVQPEDTAVYYCARYTQSHKPSVDLNKNPSVDLPCYSAIKTSDQTVSGVHTLLLLLAAGSCESLWICHSQHFFSCCRT
uniref:Ig-like domain-containing protein n=1 Tax=Seriola dumerili TaxID=41447 RepID=A0A3B4TJN7_SERDU